MQQETFMGVWYIHNVLILYIENFIVLTGGSSAEGCALICKEGFGFDLENDTFRSSFARMSKST